MNRDLLNKCKKLESVFVKDNQIAFDHIILELSLNKALRTRGQTEQCIEYMESHGITVLNKDKINDVYPIQVKVKPVVEKKPKPVSEKKPKLVVKKVTTTSKPKVTINKPKSIKKKEVKPITPKYEAPINVENYQKLFIKCNYIEKQFKNNNEIEFKNILDEMGKNKSFRKYKRLL